MKSAGVEVARPASDDLAIAGRSAPATTPSLRTEVRRGSLWSMGGYAGTQVLRFAGNLLLTRLLVPEAFGLMALVTTLLQGLQLFSDVGIGPSIIHGRRGDEPAFLNTAWTVQVLRGVLLFAVAVAIALPVATFYGDPQLRWVLVASAATVLISGFVSTRIFSMYRRVDLARVSIIELSSQAVGLVVIVAWAAVDRSVWALVGGAWAGSLARLVLSHTFPPGISNRFRWDRTALAELVRFGRWIFLSTMLTFFVGYSDRLVFGKLVPLSVLGVYSVGVMLATVPSAALGRLASSVLFPVFSRMHNAGEDLRPMFVRLRWPLLIAAGWMVAGLAGGGGVIVEFLYDARYDQAGWVVQMLSLASWFTVMEASNGAVLLARGQPHWTAAANGAKLLGMLGLIPLGYHLAGFPGAVGGLAASEVLKYAVSAIAVARAGMRGWPSELLLTGWVLASSGLGWYATVLAEQERWSSYGSAALVFAVVSLAWAPFAPSLLASIRSRTRTEAR